jgi:hypothetical protein
LLKVSASPEGETDFLGDAKVDGAYGGHSGQNSKKPEKDSTLCNEVMEASASNVKL